MTRSGNASDETVDAGGLLDSELARQLLLLAVGPNFGATTPLPASGAVTIGRGAECRVRIDHPSVSRTHAELTVGDRLFVRDLRSRNGTRVSGARLSEGQKVEVPLGAAMELGDVTVTIQRVGHKDPKTFAALRALGSPVVAPPPDHNMVSEGTVGKLLEIVDRIASDGLSVLLLGETGVGKDVFAEQIHRRSARRNAPFVRLHCAAMSENLIESELFGHEKGAFTGAVAAKAGLLETADGGTVFIDEVGELTLATQVKLLRVLEDRRVVRVGSVRAKTIDVRFVSATNRDLEAEVSRGAFRADLYYRIAGLSLLIPPLRERRSEVLPLARHFLERAARERGLPLPELSSAAQQALAEHTFPGNIRELRNVIERSVLLSQGAAILPEHLLLGTQTIKVDLHSSTRVELPAARPDERLQAGDASGPLAGEIERIQQALVTCGGNQTEAAKLLGISRRTLINRLAQYNLPRPRKR